MELFQLFLLLACGLFAGFLAGLFGIGGGVVLVPAFLFLFRSFGVSDEFSIKLAVATSLSVITITTFFTSGTHLLRGTLKREELLKLFAFSVPGVFVGALIAKVISGALLKKLFALLLLSVGIKNLLGKGEKKSTRRGSPLILYATLFTAGLFSSLFGIGGGVVINSVLFNFSFLPFEKVVGIASTSSFLNALIGTVIYSLVPAKKVLKYQLGFIYVPGALLVSAGSIVGSRLGLKLLRKISQSHLKKAFAVIIILLGIKMIFS
ncbi:sulfite exporter TauE/SafE family protein [Thermovibrio sp.]